MDVVVFLFKTACVVWFSLRHQRSFPGKALRHSAGSQQEIIVYCLSDALQVSREERLSLKAFSQKDLCALPLLLFLSRPFLLGGC